MSASSPGLCKQGDSALFCSSGLGEGWLEPEAPSPTVAPQASCPAPCGWLRWQLLLTDAPASCGIRHGGWGWGRVTEGSDSGSGGRAGPGPGPGLELCTPGEGSPCGLPLPEPGCLPATPLPLGTPSGTGCEVKPTLALGVWRWVPSPGEVPSRRRVSSGAPTPSSLLQRGGASALPPRPAQGRLSDILAWPGVHGLQSWEGDGAGLGTSTLQAGFLHPRVRHLV